MAALCRFGQPPWQRESQIAAAFSEDQARAHELVEKLPDLLHAEFAHPGGAQGFARSRPVFAGEIDRRLPLAQRVVGPVRERPSVLHEEAAGSATIAKC